MTTSHDPIEIGYQVFISDGGDEVGAVRALSAKDLTIWVENAGEFTVPLAAVEKVHFQKVVLSSKALDARLRAAIGHAHDAEEPGA